MPASIVSACFCLLPSPANVFVSAQIHRRRNKNKKQKGRGGGGGQAIKQKNFRTHYDLCWSLSPMLPQTRNQIFTFGSWAKGGRVSPAVSQAQRPARNNGQHEKRVAQCKQCSLTGCPHQASFVNATSAEPPQPSDMRDNKKSVPEKSAFDSDNDDVWIVDTLQDLDIGLWVPPACQSRYVTVSVQVSSCGQLGIEFRCRRQHRRHRRHRSRCLASPVVMFANGITVNGFDPQANPQIKVIVDLVPVGSHLQMWNGVPIVSAVHFVELVQELRSTCSQTYRGLGLAAAVDEDPTSVSLTFALPGVP